MTPFSRRDTLRLGGGALAAVAMPGCTGRPGTYPVGDVTGQLIDVHCHVFNGTDLPITTFLTRLALPSYDPKRCQLGPLSEIRSLGTIDDPDFIESVIELVVALLLSATPTAREELARLQRNQNGSAASDRARVRSLALDRLTDFLAEPPSVQASARANRMDRLRDTLWQEAGQTAKDLAARSTSARQAARRLLTSPGKFEAIFNWTKLFFRSRQSLAQELVAASRSWGREPLMLVPLMVDYTHWLGQTTDCDSTLPDQVAVHGEIARRSAVPVHAMVAYDPLRAVFWNRGKHDRFKTPEFDPLDLARRAVTDHGCVGLKLYPPMGFQATGNSNRDADYPADVIKALRPGGTLGTELDQALARAFDLCTELDVPILAHANNSLSAGPAYGEPGRAALLDQSPENLAPAPALPRPCWGLLLEGTPHLPPEHLCPGPVGNGPSDATSGTTRTRISTWTSATSPRPSDQASRSTTPPNS